MCEQVSSFQSIFHNIHYSQYLLLYNLVFEKSARQIKIAINWSKFLLLVKIYFKNKIKKKLHLRFCKQIGDLEDFQNKKKPSPASLDAIQKQAIRLRHNPTLTDSLGSPAQRRSIPALSLLYTACSEEFKSIILPKPCFAGYTRFAYSQHSFSIKLKRSQ